MTGVDELTISVWMPFHSQGLRQSTIQSVLRVLFPSNTVHQQPRHEFVLVKAVLLANCCMHDSVMLVTTG